MIARGDFAFLQGSDAVDPGFHAEPWIHFKAFLIALTTPPPISILLGPVFAGLPLRVTTPIADSPKTRK